jgi:sugar/nucleoside kinase (ribokinase family)
MINKDIKLCAIGNAIVDIQCEVADSEISKLKLEKGTMTLVSDEVQSQVLELLKESEKNISSGGSAANTVIAFSNFGGKAAYKTMIGDDDDGAFYGEEFQNLGIILDAPIDENDHTGLCVVLVTPDSERTMLTSLGATKNYKEEYISEDLIKRSEWLYIEGYKLTEDSGYGAVLATCAIAKKYDTKLAVTFSDKFIVDLFKDRLTEIAQMADLIFCNEQEAIAYSGEETREKALDFLEKNFKNVVLTLNKEGSIIVWDKKRFPIPAYKTAAIDTTGAGDMYAAGFFFGLIYSNSIERAGHLASLAASKVVGQQGARLLSSHTELVKEIYTKFS